MTRACRNRVRPAVREMIPLMIMTEKTLPHSSKIVLEILVSGDTMTHKDLVQRTRLAPKTVRYGLKRLMEHHLVIRKLNFRTGARLSTRLPRHDHWILWVRTDAQRSIIIISPGRVRLTTLFNICPVILRSQIPPFIRDQPV